VIQGLLLDLALVSFLFIDAFSFFILFLRNLLPIAEVGAPALYRIEDRSAA
jgi:hypothetical protein